MSSFGMETKIVCVSIYIFIHISFFITVNPVQIILLLLISVKLLYNEE